MADSQNGYSVVERDDCKFYDDIVEGLSLPLRDDDCGYVLAHFLRAYHDKVEPLGRTETFGHSPRRISGSNEWSNHASGTAVDANSTQHPYGRDGTYTYAEEAELRKVLEQYDGVIKWGGDFRTTKDEMHYEINKGYTFVRLLARALRRNKVVYVARLRPGARNLDVYMVKRALRDRRYFGGKLNKYFGEGLRNAYADWQRSLGYEGSDADGVPGPASLEALGFNPKV